MSAERVRTYLVRHGVQYEIHTHPIAYTTSEVAQVEHVPREQMAKAVMLMADDRLVMAVISGNQMVDMGKAETGLGADTVRLATEGEFAPLFSDCERGAEPPFGAPALIVLAVPSRAYSRAICARLSAADCSPT